MTERSETEAEPTRRLRRVRLLVAYDGTGFHGFAENTGVAPWPARCGRHRARPRHRVELTVAGRTDAGVHAWGQVVTFDAPAAGLDLERLQRSVNGLCKPAIVVRAAELAPPDFDARFSALWRRYRYTVLNRTVPDPFLARRRGTSPSRSTCRRCGWPAIPSSASTTSRRSAGGPEPAGAPPPSLVRRVVDARWDAPGRRRCSASRSRPTPSATRWCARSSACWSTWAGAGAGPATSAAAAGPRPPRPGNIAPPTGLCLWEVGYPDGFGQK